MDSKPKLRSDLVISPSTQDHATVYTVKDPVAGKYIRLREPEYWLVSQFDGHTDPATLAARFHEKFGFAMTTENVLEFAALMRGQGFLDESSTDRALTRSHLGVAPKQTLAARLLFIKLGVFRPGQFLTNLASIYRPFHRPFWFIVQLAIMAIGVALLLAHRAIFSVDPISLFSIASVAIVVVSFFLLVAFHEMAHAVVCRHYGGEIREMGFLLMYFQPCFYVDVSDAWLFPQKRHRLAVTLAGLWSQTVVMALAVIVWRITIEGTTINQLSRMVGIVCWITLLFNFNPLIKLDGYYLLSDWLDIPNLRQKAFGYLKNALQRHIFGWPVEKNVVTPRERRIFLIYSTFALAFSLFLIGYIVWVVGRLAVVAAGVTGLVLFLCLLAAILRSTVRNFGRGIVQHVVFMKALLKSPLRLISYIVVFMAVLVFVLTVPFPHRVSGDVLVQPIAEFSVALNDFGLLESSFRTGGASPENKSNFIQMMSNEATALQILPKVKDGQPVAIGDTVAVLVSNQINQQIAVAESELERLRDQLKLLKAPPKKEQVDEAQAEVSAAKTNYDQLLKEQGRAESLVAKGLSTQERLESARSATEIAQAEWNNKKSTLALVKSGPRPEEVALLDRAISKQETQLEYLRKQAAAQVIVTPIAGLVSMRPNDKRIITVFDNQRVEVSVPVSDFDISRVEIGQLVSVKVRSFPDRTFEGTVVRIPGGAERIDNGSRFPVTIVVGNNNGALRSGMSGYAKIEAGTASLARIAWRKAMSVLKVEFWSLW